MQNHTLGTVFLCILLFENQAYSQSTAKPVLPKVAEPVADNSLSLEAYEEMGIPSVKIPWGNAELKRTAAVMVKLKKTPDKLPRLNSPKSGLLFAKLIDPKTLDIATDQAQLQDKTALVQTVERMLAMKEIAQCYFMSGWPTQTMTVELVELYDPLFQIVRQMQAGSQKIVSTLDKSDPAYQFRMKSSKDVEKGLSMMVSGLTGCFNDRVYMTKETRLRLAGIVQKSLPGIINEMAVETRKELRKGIVDVQAKELDMRTKQLLSLTVDAIKP